MAKYEDHLTCSFTEAAAWLHQHILNSSVSANKTDQILRIGFLLSITNSE